MAIILILLSFFLTKFILSWLMGLLINGGAVRKNYLSHNVPVGLGLVLLFGTAPAFFLYSFLGQDENTLWIFLSLTITLLVGFIDDLLGNHDVKGLKGHLLKLIFKRELTSGALKALCVSVISLFIALNYWQNVILFILNFVILILTTNSFNLFDVRPGRAIKVYFLAGGLMYLAFPRDSIYLGIILASVIAYAPIDFRGQGMLGDTGSNFLGMSIGLALILNLTWLPQLFISIFLIVLHIYTEKKSLTELIERIYVLRFIDNLGR